MPSIVSKSMEQNYLNPLIKILTKKITKSINHHNQIKHLIQVQKLISTIITSIFKAYPLQNDQYFTNPNQ